MRPRYQSHDRSVGLVSTVRSTATSPTRRTCRLQRTRRQPATLITLSHGGPTGFAAADFKIAYQFGPRGFAILDVNYSGSSGFGRTYRDRLKGRWGVIDVQDCIAGAVSMGAQRSPTRPGWRSEAERWRLHNPGCPHDDDVFAADQPVRHRRPRSDGDRHAQVRGALSRQPGGPVSRRPRRYVERSPIHHLDRLSAPILLLQGTDDRVVLPDQAEMRPRRRARKVCLLP